MPAGELTNCSFRILLNDELMAASEKSYSHHTLPSHSEVGLDHSGC